jgi:transcriptional regulator with XRE-family HTH domain
MKTENDIEIQRLFGKNLAKIRKEKKRSQEYLALESGLARSYIGDVERGIRNISLVNICKIADTLEVDVVEIMSFRK